MNKKVLVLMGGLSAERDVSIVSGEGAVEALNRKGYKAYPFVLNNIFELFDEIRKNKPDVIFNALHGNWGEDGEIQGVFDYLQIPYTHSDLKASAVGMDKAITKMVCRGCDIRVADSEVKTFAEYKKEGTQLSFPYVVKPVCDGSSVGVFIVENEDDVKNVSYEDENREIMIEDYIPGRELTCAVWAGKALAVTELKTDNDFYDYGAKYTQGVTYHILPAEIPDEATNTCMAYAEKLHARLGCNMVSRCDFRYNEKDGVVLLEINTAPGMTPLSLVPEQAKYRGISYDDLCAQLVENAICRKM